MMIETRLMVTDPILNLNIDFNLNFNDSMLTKILLILFPAILLCTPMAFNMKIGHRMTAFYHRMASSEKARKFYMLVLLFMLLLFHWLHYAVMEDAVALVPSTVVTLCLFSYTLTDRIFNIMKRYMKTSAVLFVLTALVTLYWQALYPSVVTFGFILHASIFYPSAHVREELRDRHPMEG